MSIKVEDAYLDYRLEIFKNGVGTDAGNGDPVARRTLTNATSYGASNAEYSLNLKEGTDYYWTVSAIDAAGNEKAASAYYDDSGTVCTSGGGGACDGYPWQKLTLADSFGPTMLSLSYPIQNATLLNKSPVLAWPQALDPSGVANYYLDVSQHQDFQKSLDQCEHQHSPRF